MLVEIGDIGNTIGIIIAALAAVIALFEYLNQKDSQEQARSISVYIVRLYDKSENKWTPLKIAPAGRPTEERTESMAYGLVIENNSAQHISDFSAEIDAEMVETSCDIQGTGSGIAVFKEVKWKPDDGTESLPYRILPPGKWLISIDCTSNQNQGVDSLESVMTYGDVAYLPLLRTPRDPIVRFSFWDSMNRCWEYTREDRRLKRVGRKRG